MWTTRKTDEDAAGETKRSNSRGHGDTDAAAVDLDSVDVDITATCVCSATGRIAVGSAIGTLQYLVTRVRGALAVGDINASRVAECACVGVFGRVTSCALGCRPERFGGLCKPPSRGSVQWCRLPHMAWSSQETSAGRFGRSAPRYVELDVW